MPDHSKHLFDGNLTLFLEQFNFDFKLISNTLFPMHKSNGDHYIDNTGEVITYSFWKMLIYELWNVQPDIAYNLALMIISPETVQVNPLDTCGWLPLEYLIQSTIIKTHPVEFNTLYNLMLKALIPHSSRIEDLFTLINENLVTNSKK
jgi:hypothetical protein